MQTKIERQLAVFTEKTFEVLPIPELRQKMKRSLQQNTPLRIKIGIDPTSTKIHIGHMVPCGIEATDCTFAPLITGQ